MHFAETVGSVNPETGKREYFYAEFESLESFIDAALHEIPADARFNSCPLHWEEEYRDGVTTGKKRLSRDRWVPAQERYSRESSKHGASFTGAASVEAAAEIASNGWKEGAAMARRYMVTLEDALRSRIPKPEPYWDVEGQSVDIGRFMTGEPENMMTFDESEVEGVGHGGRIINVVVNISASAAIGKEAIMRRGAAMLAAVDALENWGRRCRVVVDMAAQGHPHSMLVRVVLKQPEAVMNVSKLAFPMAHPAMLRRLMFAIMECFPPEAIDAVGAHAARGYGMPVNTPKEMQGDVYMEALHAYDDRWQSPETAEEWVMKLLAEQGLPVTMEAV